MIHRDYLARTGLTRFLATVSALALLALPACVDSTGDPVPSPTPRSVLFATPPSAASTGADDESGSDITVELNQTATPYPTSTPYPTATPYPAPTPYPVAVGSGGQTSGPGPSVPEVTTIAPQAGPTIRIAIPKKSEVKHPKADSAINSLVERVESGEITAEEAAKEAPLHRGESVGVIILLSGNVGGVVAFLEANGATNINAGEDYIEAFVPVLLLGQASEQPGVLRVDQIQPPGETQGTPQVTGQGPGVHGSRAWNDAGYSGQGIKVGVIDRGFSGFSDIMGTEVPATVEARCYIWLGQHSQNLPDCSDGGTHGTIVSESVLDISPQVTLYISDPQSLSELRDAVDWMISEGVSVINHSRLWTFDGPGDGTSPLSISPLNSIDRAVTAGIVWVNAAGNQATGTWFKRGPFDYTTETIDGEEVRFLRFSGSEIRNNSYIGGRLELRWDDDWGGAETDLDLFALTSGTDEIALQSIDLQSGSAGHNPYESVGSLATFDVMVAHRGGPEPDWVQLVGWGPTRLTLNSSGTGSIINPAESASPGMLAVGAAPWYDVNILSGFSSRGPAPDGRIKPDVVAANCGETATGGQGFCGTSQASPHVAGMAALVRQRFPNYSPTQVVSYLKDNAEQRISNPDPNNTWGHGFFVLPPVTQPPQTPVMVPGAPTQVSAVPGNDSLNLSWNSPGQTGGAAITAYDMRHIRSDATNKGDANWTVVQDVWAGAGAHGYKLADLDGGTQYDVQVRAVNSAGDGPWSATATGTPTSPILSSDAALSALTVIPVVIGFHLSVTTYHVGVANDVSRVTVVPVARNAGATVRVDGTVLSRGSSRAVFLDEGSNVITFTVTAGDGRTTKTYTVTIDRGSDDPFGWKVTDDFQLDQAFDFRPRGLWRSGSVFWMACTPGNDASIGAKLCAYNPATKEQWDGYHTLATHRNWRAEGIWSDGTTMWVSDSLADRIYAYKTRSYFRDTSKEFDNLTDACSGDFDRSEGIWSDGATMWVADSLCGKLYAYDMATKLRAPAKDFDTLGDAGNWSPGAIWSDGTTMWVTNNNKLYAYDMATKLRAPAKDFDTLIAADNGSASGIWSDGVTMWVTDSASNRIFSYNMPPQSALGPLARPGPPRDLRATPRNETSIALSWSPPLNDGGTAITGYRIEVSQDGSNWRNYVAYTGSTSTNDGHNALIPGSTYFYRVSAINAISAGPASNIATTTTTGAALTSPCAIEGAVPDAPNNPGLVADCETLLAAKVILAGTGSFGRNWSASTPITQWQGVLALGLPRRVTRVSLANMDLNGTIPEALGTLSALRELVLRDNDLTGDIPPVLGNLTNLTELKLDGNELAGTIPKVLGNLNNLEILWLSNNNLGGTIPSELGNLGNLQVLFLRNNRLSGEVPQELGKLSKLFSMSIGRNQLTGCIPSSLDGRLTGTNTDLGGLEYCADATVPGAPTGLTATASGEIQIDLSWTAPADDGGEAITGYRIEVSTDRLLWSDLVSNSRATRTSHSHTGLAAGSTWYYRVSAINSAGTGSPSNVAEASTDAMAVPDLEVDVPTVDTSAPAAGVRFTLSATVRNQGSGRSDSTTLRYYQSADSSITTSDTEIGTDSVFRLDALETGDESISLTAPDTPGTYYYGACVDAVSDESDNANNCSVGVSVTVGATPSPDLVVDGPTVSENAPAAGERFTLSATVRNQGSGRSDSTTLRYYQSADSSITTSGTEVGTDSVFRLDALETGDESVTLTAPDTPSTYYYGACVDALSDETDTANNCSVAVSVTVGAAPSPDLVVDGPTVSESSPEAGARFTLNAAVRNQGNGPSAFTTLRYYQSTDSVITTGDTEVGTDSVSRINALGTGDESASLTAPDTPGTYYYGACVDALSDETDTANNCSAAVTVAVGAAPAPDLVVDRPTVSESSPDAGARFTLNAAVRNQGNGPSAFTTLRYYRSTDSAITTSDTEVGTDSVFRLDALETGDESFSLTAPHTPGTYYYGTCVDVVSDETDMANNCSVAVTVTVGAAPAPDLVVNTPTVSESAPDAGERFTLTATVRNQGSGPSALTTLRYYQSVDSSITTGDTAVGTDSVSGLNSSESGDESISLTAPSTPGTYYYGACVESASDESDTANNCSVAVTVTVGAAPAPDLVVDTPTVSEGAPAAGARFTLNVTVRNQGNGPSDSTTLRYYRSTDSTITTGDTEVDTDSVSRINVLRTGDESASLTAPDTPGTYYYGACVDSLSDETDTANNCSAAVTVTVGAAPSPDLVVDGPTVSESAPDAGARFMLTATVRNQGSGRSDSTTLRYYQSADSTITTGDTEVGTDSVVQLDASESGDESASLTAPDTPGTYYYGACVEAVSDESDNANNCSVAVSVTVGTVTAPDLVVSTFTVGNSGPVPGQYFTLNATVYNQGNGPSGSTTLSYYRSTDATITTGDVTISTAGTPGYLSLGGLSPSGSVDRSASTPAPSALGTYYYGACVETVTGESDTTNNCSPGATVTVERTNQPPRLTGDVDDKVVEFGNSFTVDLSGLFTDPDGDDITSYGFRYRIRGILSGTVNTMTGILSLRAIAVGETIVAVDARDSNGASGASEDLFKVTVTEAETADKPSAPTGLAATADGQTEIDLSWTAPSDDGGADITGYKIEVSTNGTSWTDLVDDTNSTTTSYGHTGLTAGSTRHYRVSAINSEGTGPVSNTDSATTNAATKPGKPTGLSATADGQTEIDLSWSAPSDGGGASITGYRIEVSNNGSDWTDLVTDTDSTSTSYSHSGLSAGSTRHYRVSAINSEGTGPVSNTDSATTDAAMASDLTVDPPTVDHSTLETGDSFTLSATVRNQGDGSSGSTTLRYYRSSDSTITSSDTSVGTGSVSGLNAGGSSDETIDLTAPDTPGTYYYGACVDSVSGESDATNNCSSGVAVTVSAATAPDLTVDTPTVDDSSLETGDSFTLSATVRNGGDASSASTTLRYYRSTDSTIASSDTSVGTGSVSGLNAGGSSDETIDLTAPDTPGTYYYGACVDSVSGESDTTNNCSSAVTVTVSAAPAPDPDPDPTPTGTAVTGSVTSCEGEQVAPGIDSYEITIEGTVTAKRAVKNVRVDGTFNGSFVGIDVVGDMEAGETASFSVSGIVFESVGTCGANVEWLEIN